MSKTKEKNIRSVVSENLRDDQAAACLVEESQLEYSHQSAKKIPLERPCYLLGKNYPGVSLSFNEARCLAYFVKGLDDLRTAVMMNFSLRTVHFYLNIIRVKIPCRSMDELIELVKKTDFFLYMDELV